MVSKPKKGQKIKKDTFVPKTITISKKQDEWITKNWVNLSRFVQGKLDEIMTI